MKKVLSFLFFFIDSFFFFLFLSTVEQSKAFNLIIDVFYVIITIKRIVVGGIPKGLRTVWRVSVFSISPLLLGNQALCLLIIHIVIVIERRIVAHSLDPMVNRLLSILIVLDIVLPVTVLSHEKSFRHFGWTVCICVCVWKPNKKRIWK